MKRFVLLFVLLVSITEISSQQNTEFRATWLTNVDSFVLTSDNSIVEAVNYLSSIGINVIFPVVYNKGYTVYPSAIMDSLFGVKVIPQTGFQNRDFLERLLIEAHRVGIEVIPWFEFGFSSSYSLNGGHIVAKFPHWATKNNQGNLVVKNGFDWLSGINPEVQDYMLSLVMEVIDNYDVDGVQGDDRLPAMPVEGGYDSVTVEIYKAEHGGNTPPLNAGDTNWKRWRADKLNEFHVRMRDSVKSRGENLILSSSPTPYPWGYNEYLQDSRNWAQDGIVDNIIPQLYRYDLISYQLTLNESLTQIRNVNPDIYFAGVLTKAGTYVISYSLLLSKLQLNRNNNVNGECTFFYEALRANNSLLGDTLNATYYNQPALVPYRNGKIWRPKATINNEDDPETIVTGNWVSYPLSGFEGTIIRTNDSINFAAVEYFVDVPFSAHFDVFAFLTPNSPWTQQANYVVYSDTDSINQTINQANLSKRGWHKIGTAYLSQGNRRVMKIDNSQLEPGKWLVADAVMIMINRKLSPDVIVTSIEDEMGNDLNVPENFSLSQNYPNPFNPTTVISWQSAVGSRQVLKVFDVLGKEITTLLDEYKPAGNYEVEFNADKLSSGVYFYQLNYGSFVQTKKMILLR
ncbi:MAG TPA: family 10 glycosylhydrolase [Ignavibacteriaceae bacterium]|nr:family 10 glycosylhydrolase [Ignavibacteriaceae bacterium]